MGRGRTRPDPRLGAGQRRRHGRQDRRLLRRRRAAQPGLSSAGLRGARRRRRQLPGTGRAQALDRTRRPDRRQLGARDRPRRAVAAAGRATSTTTTSRPRPSGTTSAPSRSRSCCPTSPTSPSAATAPGSDEDATATLSDRPDLRDEEDETLFLGSDGNVAVFHRGRRPGRVLPHRDRARPRPARVVERAGRRRGRCRVRSRARRQLRPDQARPRTHSTWSPSCSTSAIWKPTSTCSATSATPTGSTARRGPPWWPRSAPAWFPRTTADRSRRPAGRLRRAASHRCRDTECDRRRAPGPAAPGDLPGRPGLRHLSRSGRGRRGGRAAAGAGRRWSTSGATPRSPASSGRPVVTIRRRALPESLIENGFIPDEPESIMIGEARLLAVDVVLPDGVTLRRVSEESDVRAMCAMQDEVFGGPVDASMPRHPAAPARLRGRHASCGSPRRDGAHRQRRPARAGGRDRVRRDLGRRDPSRMARPRDLPGADGGARPVRTRGWASR